MKDELKLQGGEHYKAMAIQPMEFCEANMTLAEYEGAMKWNIQKYCWRDKENKLEDLRKIKHYCDLWSDKLIHSDLPSE